MDIEEIKDQERNSVKENKASPSDKKDDNNGWGCFGLIMSLIVVPAFLIYHDCHWGWIVAYVIVEIISYCIYEIFFNSK